MTDFYSQKHIRDLEKDLTSIYNKYYDDIYRNIYYIVNQEELTKDLINDLFYKIWKKKELLLKINDQKNYLYIAAKNIALDAVKQQKKKIDLPDIADYSEKLTETNTPLDLLSEKELALTIQMLIEELPPKRKLFFKLCRIENKSYKEIASLYNVSLKTIEDHIRKALLHIKTRLKELHPNESDNI